MNFKCISNKQHFKSENRQVTSQHDKEVMFPTDIIFDCQGLEAHNKDVCHFHYALLLCLRHCTQSNKTRNINKKQQFGEKIVFSDKELDYFFLRL